MLLAYITCPHVRIVFKKRSDFHSPLRVSISRFVKVGDFGTGKGQVDACGVRRVGRLRPLHFPRPSGRRSNTRRKASRGRRATRVRSPSRNGDRASVVSRVANRVGLFWGVGGVLLLLLSLFLNLSSRTRRSDLRTGHCIVETALCNTNFAGVLSACLSPVRCAKPRVHVLHRDVHVAGLVGNGISIRDLFRTGLSLARGGTRADGRVTNVIG